MNTAENNEREIFAAAHELAADERIAFLKWACAGNQPLFDRVQALLHASESSDNLFDVPRFATTIAHSNPETNDDSGSLIGRYKLLERIGEGGMAVVYMAEQEQPVRRKVAIKLVKPGMDSESVVARFEAERQALARMDHPHIAKIFDGGATDQGRPYFVMELVRGIPITEYCDQNRLGNNARLELFIHVCQAVQHAHQKGIIHRDLKPSNILVTLADGKPVPKVIDFGIAKATRDPLTDKTLFTRFHYFVGTPAYMSPEQAQLGPLDIDTRTDIYSLGALLYELLTGRTPFDPEQLSSLEDCRRTILEEEPRPPSSRILSYSRADLQATAARRRAESNQLVRALQSDLDWITMKCLDKERARRYESADALAQDVSHYLVGDAVVARPPSALYRAQKFVRRNKVTVAIASIVVVASIVSTWQAIRATRAVVEQNRLRAAVETALKQEERQRRRAEAEELAALRRAYSSDMMLAQQAFQRNNIGRTIGILNRYQTTPELRNLRSWEWRYFWGQTRSEAAFALPQQSDAIVGIALSGDARILATGDMGGRVKLWDLTKRRELQEFQPSIGRSSVFAVSHDGSMLATIENGDVKQTLLKVRSLAERKVTQTIQLQSWPTQIVFGRDDSSVLLLSRNLGVQAISLRDGTSAQILVAKSDRRWNQGYAAISSDRTKVVGLDDGEIRVWSLETGERISTAEGHGEQTWSLTFSPDGETLAVGPSSSAPSTDIYLYSVSTGEEIGRLKGHASWVPAMVFTPGGRQLVSAGADQTVRIWDVAKQKERTVLRGHRSEIYRVVVSSDAATIVSGSKDGSLLVWDSFHDNARLPYESLPIPVAQIEFVSGSDELLVLDPKGRVTLWNSRTLRPLESIDVLGHHVTTLCVSENGNRVFASSDGGQVTVLDWPTRQVIRKLPAKIRQSKSKIVGLANNDKILVYHVSASTFASLDTNTWKHQTLAAHIDGDWLASSTRLSPDGKYLGVGGIRGPLHLVNLETEETIRLEEAEPWGASDLAFSPNGTILAASSLEGIIRFWNTSTWKVTKVLRGHLIGVNAIAFSPDGTRFASASQGDEAVKLWDVSSGLELTTLQADRYIEDHLQFSPSGNLVVGITSQQEAIIWRAPSFEEIQVETSNESRAIGPGGQATLPREMP